MRSGLGCAVAGLVCLTFAAGGPAQAATLTDGDTYGSWRVVFAGYGSVTATPSKLTLQPAVATTADTTHAALVVGTSQTNVRLKTRVTLNAQLRTGSSANPWETGWLVTRYQDPEHFYYVALKTNGWDLGKRDPAYPGGQRFLATGDSPAAEEGASQQVVLTASGNKISVRIDGEAVTTFTDTQRPYRSGAVGFYAEDAAVTFDKISVASL